MPIKNIYTFRTSGNYITPISQIIIHSIPLENKICGIYRMDINDHFYIGQSLNVFGRAKRHVYDINRHFNDVDYVSKTSKRVIQYFKKHKEINEIHLHLLEVCSMDDLAVKEHRWLAEGVLDNKCLNTDASMRYNPVLFKKQIELGVHELKFNLETIDEVRLYRKFLRDLKRLKKCNI